MEPNCFQGLISADHPSLAGHFPGNPVAPGVVLLEEVAQAFMAWQPELRLSGIAAAKFLIPLQPEQSFLIYFERTAASIYRFSCIREEDDARLAHGRFIVHASSEFCDV